MSTLITLTLPNGTVHTCDESCYNSTHRDCSCICEGRNHGKGISQAEGTTIIRALAILNAIAKIYPNFIELRIHFHNTGQPDNLTRHEVLDQQRVNQLERPFLVNYYQQEFEPTIHQPDHLEQANADPTKAAQAARNEPDR